MIFAVVDLGTNTFNLLIGERRPGNSFVKLFNTKVAVKLGENGINAGYISEKPFHRGIEALKKYRALMAHYKTDTIMAFGTSAIRSASNKQAFIDAARQEAGIDITIIDGNEEAELIYYGNRMAVAMSDAISLIMDIGGGSNEFILCNRNEIFWKQSFKLGAARLLEKFTPSDPITTDEITAFNAYLRQELQPLSDAILRYKPVELIGSSGAFESVVDMIAGKFNSAPVDEACTEYDVNLGQYEAIHRMILASTLEERRQVKGLIEMRVDMMVISCLLIGFILDEYKLRRLRVSTYSLKEGVISKQLGLHP